MDNQTDLINWATGLAESLLKNLEPRWSHVKGVVKRAYKVSSILDEDDKQILIVAAYLHDIGYSPEINKLNFHPLDGALYLKSLGKERLASLIAHHSCAVFEANLRGLSNELSEFENENSVITHALCYCDLTTNSKGEEVTYQERLDDIFERYDEEHVVSIAVKQSLQCSSLSVEYIVKLLNENK